MTDKMIVKVLLAVFLICLLNVSADNEREGRKLFGGYKITPRFCKPTRRSEVSRPGPNICMFNHECASRQGIVVGACMDGFLFGACCNLPGQEPGELISSDNIEAPIPINDLRPIELKTTKEPNVNVMSNGFSEITLTTGGDNDVVQIGNQRPEDFIQTGVTHSVTQETYLLNGENNEILPLDFSYPTKVTHHTTTERGSTPPPYTATSPLIQISISPGHTVQGYFQKPMFRPKPTTSRPEDDKYVLVPTISHSKPNKTSEFQSIENILHMLNGSTTDRTTTYSVQTTNRPPSTSYIFSTNIPRRPTSQPTTLKTTSRKPPSTSYVFSSTPPPRRTTTSTRPGSTGVTITAKPTKPTYATSTKRPTSSKPNTATKRPKPTTVVLSPPTKKPSVQTANVSGPSFSVSTPTRAPFPSSSYAPTSTFGSGSTPNIIVFAPVTESAQQVSTSKPPKPVTQLTINNVVTATNNYYSTTARPPNPTIHITPKPPALLSTGGYLIPITSTEVITSNGEIEGNNNEFINFPPVRNPNLNISASIATQDEDLDFTTPAFDDDAVLNTKVEKFVNKIVQSLQEPFSELKDIVYDKKNTTRYSTSTKRPTTSKKPTKAPTSKPTTKPRPGTIKPVTTRPTTTKVPTRRPTTSKRPVTTTSKRPITTVTTRRPKPTKKVTTTPVPDYIEEEEETQEQLDYRKHCGVRPLVKTGRIVGGKGATFGEWPWQVLVRESTWLGLFTKNKCGGVLISQRYVITAAHCQPGFLASLVAVFGEYDISGELESKRSMSKNVKRVIVHRQYDAATFENDLALLELESPVNYDEHIVPICLPDADTDFTGRMATVTGWGRLKYGGGVPAVLQEVQVPVMENHVCQEMFRTAGHSKIILDSFLCAGYANGQKDSCEGDSGGPLVMQRPDGRWELAGTVSHGIKCAAPYLPGVYMRTTYFKPWLESITGVH